MAPYVLLHGLTNWALFILILMRLGTYSPACYYEILFILIYRVLDLRHWRCFSARARHLLVYIYIYIYIKEMIELEMF
jgi:hypothetical protein